MFDVNDDPILCQPVLLPSLTNIHFPNTASSVMLLYPLKPMENLRIYECIRNRDITLLCMEGGEH
jgi:hypothetical protein